MSKSSGDFLRLQTILDRGYDALAYRFFCMSAHYRARLSFTWEGLDSAARSLDRLRIASHELGASGTLDEGYADRFAAHINDDLNLPRAVALTWELVKSDLLASTKKASLLFFDQVLGLNLGDWRPVEEALPPEITGLVQRRLQARLEKRWQDADSLRSQVLALGYEIEDTKEGPRIKKKKVFSD